MTNISKRNIHTADFKLVQTELLKVLTKLNTRTSKHLIDELLTESERIMVIKRFGAVFMFTQGYSPYRVSETLGVSQPTAHRIFRKYMNNGYAKLLGCSTKKERSRFLQVLEDLIAAQASPKARARLVNNITHY